MNHAILDIYEFHTKENYDKIFALSHEIQQQSSKHAKEVLSMDWLLRLKIASDIVSGIAFMHSLNPPLLHRDIKSPNIFLVRSPVGIDRGTDEFITTPLAKVGDLGLSVHLFGPDRVRVAEGHQLENLTATWAAPEVIGGKGYSTEADVYGVGIILWELLMQLHPFSEDLEGELMLSYFIEKGNRPSIPAEVERSCPKEYLSLMRDCWHPVPKQRPKIHIVHHRLKSLMKELAPRMAKLTPDAPLSSLPAPSSVVSPLLSSREDSLKWEVVKIPLQLPNIPKNSPVVMVQRPLQSPKKVTCMAQVGSILWIGFGDGTVGIYQDHQTHNTGPAFLLEQKNSKDSPSPPLCGFLVCFTGGKPQRVGLCNCVPVFEVGHVERCGRLKHLCLETCPPNPRGCS